MLINERTKCKFVKVGDRRICKPIQIEQVEMDVLKIDGKFYERGHFYQSGFGIVTPYPEYKHSFDDFDTEVQCEEAYHE